MEENSVNQVEHQTDEHNPSTSEGTRGVIVTAKSKPMHPTPLYA